MTRVLRLRPPSDRALAVAAAAAGTVALVLGPPGAVPAVGVLLVACGWAVGRARAAERRAADGWRTALGRQAALEQELAAHALPGDPEAGDRPAGDLLAQVAHELRGPLAPIRAAAEAISATPGLPPAAAAAATVVGRQARHLGRLVDDLLDVTRAARGRMRLVPVRTDLREIIGDAVEAARPGLDLRRHTLAVDLSAGPLAVDADPGRLVQVFNNLLTNAAKYTPDGGRVRVTAERSGGSVVVRVADTGLGLPADQLDRVFEPFAQLDGGRDRAAGGLGLGLALVRSLVGLHGGTVTAESPGPRQGSTFTVTLPAAGPPAPPAPGGLSVLVVDDHPDAADSLAGLLRLLGHRAAVAHDGPAGLLRARELRPDVLLLDRGLPGLSGDAVAAAVRADPGLGGVRVVAVSGRDGEPGGPFDDYLLKPVGLADLLRVLAAPPRPTRERGNGLPVGPR